MNFPVTFDNFGEAMKRIIAVASIALLAMTATARPIGTSKSGASRSIGVTRPASPAPRPAYQAPRPTATQAPAPSQYHAAPAPATVPAQSGGGGFMSSFLGGAAGAAVGNALTQPHGTTVVNAGGGAPAAVPVVAGTQLAAPGQVVTYAETRSFTSRAVDFAVGIVLLGLIVGGAIWGVSWLIKRNEKRKDDSMPSLSPISTFMAVNQAFHAADRATLERYLTPDCLAAAGVPDKPDDGALGIEDVNCYETSDPSKAAARTFRFGYAHAGQHRREDWTFVLRGDRWLVDGIRGLRP